MRARDLDLKELLDVDEAGGILRLAGERVLLLDAVALGLLRRELIDTLGLTGARAVLTRFGYAHGWRTAENLRSGLPWDSDDDWRHARSNSSATSDRSLPQVFARQGQPVRGADRQGVIAVGPSPSLSARSSNARASSIRERLAAPNRT